MSTFRFAARYLRAWRGLVLVSALSVLLLIALQLLMPQLVSWVIDTALTSSTSTPLIIAALIYVLAGLAGQALRWASSLLHERLRWLSTNAFRSDLLAHCLHLDLGFYQQYSPGQMLERIDGDSEQLGHLMSRLFAQVLSNILLIIAVLALLWLEDWRIGVALLIYSIIVLLVLSALQNLGTAQWEQEREATSKHYGMLEELLQAREDLQALGARSYALAIIRNNLHVRMLRYRAARMISELGSAGSQSLFVLGGALGLGLGAYLYMQGAITLGTCYLIVSYIALLNTPLEQIREQIQELQQAQGSVTRIQDMLAQQIVNPESGTQQLSERAPQVEFAHVNFRYADQVDYTLQNINFRLGSGQTLGILGRTGSGKTTLTRLLMRLYELETGNILLDSVDIATVPLKQLRQRIALVSQQVQLFPASIRDNLRFFDTSITDSQIEQAIEILGLTQWVRDRGGLDAQLEHGQSTLSAGEAQLLAIVRVALRNPSLVILDEASARLDPSTEQLLQQALQRFLQGRTAIIIAHRLATLEHVDQILILQDGEIIEYGPRQYLADQNDSHFAHLLQQGIKEVLA